MDIYWKFVKVTILLCCLLSPFIVINSTKAQSSPEMEGVISSLLGELKNQNVEVRLNAVRALGGINGDPKLVVPGLILALQDPNKLVSYSAAIALADLGEENKAVFPLLLKALQDSGQSDSLHSDAVYAVGNIALNLEQKVKDLSNEELKQAIANLNQALQIVQQDANFPDDAVTNIIQPLAVLQHEQEQH